MGLDVGDRRIGLAVGDSESRVAVPIGVLDRTGSDVDWRAVLDEAESHGAETLVVGMPLSMNGRKGPQAESVDAFVTRLRSHTSMPIVTIDERLTTVEAGRLMREGRGQQGRGQQGRGQQGRAKGKRAPKGAIDAAAAAVILQAWLDAQRG
jgi:putative Holliday junction resolvase